jgi:hypothetical protein
MRKLVLVALTLALTMPSPAFAWGALAHRLITARAIDALPAEIKPFFVHFKDELVLRSNDPDLWREAGFDEEAPNHFIDLGADAYGPYPFTVLPRELGAAVEKFGVATVKRNGLLPWRTTEEFGNLVRVMRGFHRGQLYADGNTVLFAAALAHYVEDAHQPLHAHNNYDGQFTAQTGLHGRFESELVERFESRLALDPPAIVPVENASAFIWAVVLDSHELVPKLLDADKMAIAGKDTYDDEYFERFLANVRPVLERQLSRSVSATASAIAGAWEQAGRPLLTYGRSRPVERVRKK